jgi:DNA-binding protein YbaB
MDPQQWLQNYQQKIAGFKRASEQLKENLGNALVTMSSPDEAVTVTIGPNGSLKNLQLSHRAAEHTPQQLGPLIMTTVRRAQRVMAEKVLEAVSEFGGGESDATKLLRNYLPEDPNDHVQDDESVGAFEEGLTEQPPAEEPAFAPPQGTQAPVAASQGRGLAFTPPPPPQPSVAPAPAVRPRAARAADAGDDDVFEESPW